MSRSRTNTCLALIVLLFNILFFNGVTNRHQIKCLDSSHGLWYDLDQDSIVANVIILVHAFFAMVPTAQFVKVFFTMPKSFGFFYVDYSELRQAQGFGFK